MRFSACADRAGSNLSYLGRRLGRPGRGAALLDERPQSVECSLNLLDRGPGSDPEERRLGPVRGGLRPEGADRPGIAGATFETLSDGGRPGPGRGLPALPGGDRTAAPVLPCSLSR